MKNARLIQSGAYRAGEGIRTLDVNLGKVIRGLRDQRLRMYESARACRWEHASVVQWWEAVSRYCKLAFLDLSKRLSR